MASPSQARYGVVVERDFEVRMRDGVNLYADVYRPARESKPVEDRFPVILVRTSYNKQATESDIDTDYFVQRGYVVVLQDVRGRYRSGGSYYHGIYETDDGYDTIEAIAKQPWSNGKIGMTGISYLAAVQTAAAISGAPHLSSLFHVKAPANYYQDGFRRGGAFLMYFVTIIFMFAATSKEAMRNPQLAKALNEASEITPFWIRASPLKKGMTPVSEVPDTERWLFDAMNHCDYDEYWKSVPLWQPVEYFEKHLDVAGHYLGGWFDKYNESPLFIGLSRKKKKKETPTKLLMGPWTHMDTGRTAGDVDFGPEALITYEQYNELQLRWFDQTLRGVDNGIVREPPVKIFVMGGGSGRKTPEGRLDHGGQWRYEHEWPLARTKYTPYYLRSNARLSPDLPTPSEPSSESYTYDPRNPVPTVGGTSYFLQMLPPPEALSQAAPDKGVPASRLKLFVPYGPHDQRERRDYFACTTNLPLNSRSDVLTFETNSLSQEVEVTGPIQVKVWASSSAVDTDFTAKLIDVHPPNEDYPEGYAMYVTDSIIRARYRNGFEKGELMTPSEKYQFTISLPPVSNAFAKGHRIRLDISSSNYPTFDPNPNTGDPYTSGGKTIVADNTIYHDLEHPSHALLPIILP